jgi:hypothetical protein
MSYQLSKLFTHSQIVIATVTKSESPSSGSNLSAVKAETTRERFRRALLFAAADAILVTHPNRLVGHGGRWTAAVVARARGIDDLAEAAALTLIHPIGTVRIGH